MGEPSSSSGEGPDDLEITSIGALYRGPWDKKYWSCSRGKDRYPYPIGYHAVRTHAGSTYTIEIHEGLKGPKFVVTSTDGDSCTGQTPDIAWDNFQKKSGPRVKNWHGKRFSCKVDGIEAFAVLKSSFCCGIDVSADSVCFISDTSFLHVIDLKTFVNDAIGNHHHDFLLLIVFDLVFLVLMHLSVTLSFHPLCNYASLHKIFGFRNPFVQRLLRELVANVNGMAERSLASSNICNGASQLDCELRMQDSHPYPDLLPYMLKQHTKKRSTKYTSSNISFSKEARAKRICCQNLPNNVAGGASEQVGGLCLYAKDDSPVHIQAKNMSFSKDGSLATHAALHHPNHSLEGSVAALHSETPCQAGPECQNDGNSIGVATSFKNFLRNEGLGTSSLHASVSGVVEEDCHLLASSDCYVEKHVISHEQCKAIGRETSMLTDMEDRVSHADKRLLDRLPDVELEQGNPLVEPKDSFRDIPAWERYPNICVSDTFYTTEDDTAGFALEYNMGSLCSMKNDAVPAEPMLRTSTSCALEVISRSIPNELISKNKICSSEGMHSMVPETCTPVDALSKESIKDSLQGVGSSSGSSNPSSEKVDLDLAGQELARSMMTFLLPRAVPLLKKTYVKRRSRYRNRETKCDPCSNLVGADLAECNVKNDHLTDCIYEGELLAGTLTLESEEKISEQAISLQKILGVDSLCELTKVEPHDSSCMADEPVTEAGISKDVKSIIPDSFDNDQCLCDIAINRPSLSGFDEADAAPSGEIKHNIVSSKSPVNDTGWDKESSTCVLGNDRCNKLVMLPEELVKGEKFLSDSLAACVHPDKLIPLEEKFNEEPVDDGEKIPFPEHADMPSLHPSRVMHNSSLYFNGDCIYNAKEEMLPFEGMPVHTSLKSHKAEQFEQDPPAQIPNYENLGDSEVLKTILTQSFSINGSPDEKLRSSSPHELINSGVPAIDFGDGNLRSQVCALRIPQVGLDGKAVVNGKGSSSFFCMPNVVPSTGGPSPDRFKEGNLPHSPLSYGKCNIPLSESIICRNLSDSNACVAPVASPTAENGQSRNKTNDLRLRIPVSNEIRVDKKPHMLDAVENTPLSESVSFTVNPGVSENQGLVKSITEGINPYNFIDPSVSCFEKNGVDALTVPVEWRKDFSDPSRNKVLEPLSCSDKNLVMKSTSNNDCKSLSYMKLCLENRLNVLSTEESKSNKEFGGCLELVGCYLHPNPVLSILLRSTEDCLQICVLCGLFDGRDINLFIYKVPIKELKGSCPSFVGYSSLVLPLLKGPFDGNVPFERFGMQFTPDGLSLVFHNGIKAPNCREQNINCLCSTCKSDCAEESAVIVAYVRYGYLSPMAKFTTNDRVSCILVCEPNYLIAAEESGRLQVWIMNCTWSANLEEFMLPNFDYVSPAILELKRVPKCDSLIIGHNGIGSFGLWDISKRSFLAKFSSPGHTIFQIVPISLVSQEQIKETVPSLLTTNNWLPEFCETPFVSSSGENIAVWLLVSAVSDSDARHDQVKQPNTSPVGCWRLGLLAKNMMIVGSMLDPRASAVDASADYGVIGTCDGLLYRWELSTGKKLANLQSFKSGCVSRIAVDAKSGALAVAIDERKLLVYVQTCKESW